MDSVTFCVQLIESLPAAVRRRVDDLTDDQLRWRPAPRANHVNFILWHALRIDDLRLGQLKGTPAFQQIWQSAGFRDRTGYDPQGLGARGLGVGTGYTVAMVDGVPVGKELITGYADAICREMVTWLKQAGPDALDRASENPFGGPQTAAQVIEGVVRQTYGHLGEADYVRGLMGIPDPTMPQEE